MNQKELKELIDFLIEKDISEFELERGDVKVRIKRGGETAAPVITHAMPMATMPMVAPRAQASHTSAAAAPPPQALQPHRRRLRRRAAYGEIADCRHVL